MLRPSFSKTSLDDLEMFEAHVSDLVKAVRCEGSVVDLKDLSLGLTADRATHSMYGESIDSLRTGSLSEFMEAFHEAQHGCESRARWEERAIFLPQWKFYSSFRVLQQYMEQHAKKVRQNRKPHEGASTAKIEERYILLRKLGNWIHDESRLRDELLTILIVRGDTTANLLCSLFLAISKTTDVWLQLRAEVDRLNRHKPTLEQLKQMQYVKHCLNESESALSPAMLDESNLVNPKYCIKF